MGSAKIIFIKVWIESSWNVFSPIMQLFIWKYLLGLQKFWFWQVHVSDFLNLCRKHCHALSMPIMKFVWDSGEFCYDLYLIIMFLIIEGACLMFNADRSNIVCLGCVCNNGDVGHMTFIWKCFLYNYSLLLSRLSSPASLEGVDTLRRGVSSQWSLAGLMTSTRPGQAVVQGLRTSILGTDGGRLCPRLGDTTMASSSAVSSLSGSVSRSHF